MSWPAALLWMIMLAAAFSNGPALIYLMQITASFGTLQMLPGGGGGVNLLPQSVCGAIFVCKTLAQRGNVTRGIEAALDPQRLALFSAFLVYGVLGAQILPRVFSGMFEVVPVSSVATDILKPSSGNFTQSCYMIMSYGTALSFAVLGQSAAVREHYRLALLAGAFMLVATGVLDFLTFTLHIGGLLDPFRTASYALLTDNEVDGAKRIVGLMPEASSYGSTCVGLLALILFMRPLYRQGREQVLAVIAIALLAAMSALSTSSTAIVGLAVTGAIYGLDLLVRMLDPSNSRRDQLNHEITLIVLVVFAIFVGLVLKPSLIDPIYSMLDRMVFQKAASSSYAERSLWNRVGWHAFLDSGGIGAGLGSIRVSNWAISILGSTGLFGAVLMFGFILQQLVAVPRKAPPEVGLFTTVQKLGVIPTLVMYQLSGTIPDIGLTAAATLGLISASHLIRREDSSAPRRSGLSVAHSVEDTRGG